MLKILEAYDGKSLPKVETNRLILRQRTVEDVEDLFAYASLPEVCLPAGFPPVATLEEEREYIESKYLENLVKENLPSGYGITVKGSNRVIGSCDVNHRRADDVFEIGYLLHPDFWGKGYMPEAVAALIEVAFTLLHLHKVEIRCYSSNQQSKRVAEKLGFTFEATIRDYKDLEGNRVDELVYGLLRTEWEEKHHAPSY
ncbi:GNAT family N-acetyltransferase [Streptococcus zhangguiae]|uniref:GNAT family N-acetyltransferase n=1 Tax=Streptococcus zhangguiae TaxID=2664091 RepID=A0A6I4RBZ2_9STRE|nr:GNAT family N-acetyltransferase [Streptococcus sp. zg-70]MWV56238.1 GNAT family N-acetyltransferase [Streptococcus sp. zg-70]